MWQKNMRLSPVVQPDTEQGFHGRNFLLQNGIFLQHFMQLKLYLNLSLKTLLPRGLSPCPRYCLDKVSLAAPSGKPRLTRRVQTISCAYVPH
jgi:hypothetical protein